MKLLLASNSPRRKELLQNLGYKFDVVSLNCDEVYPENLEIDQVAVYLSELKSNSFRDLEEDEVLITADTIVSLDNQILGKPKNHEEAKQMLQQLSGKVHQVYTGITLRNSEKSLSKTDVASVEFSPFTEMEIDFYIENYKPYDKAGSYGIQEWLGMAKIKTITGSFYTIMGLPTHLVYTILKDLE